MVILLALVTLDSVGDYTSCLHQSVRSYPYSFTLGVTLTPATPALPVPLMAGNPYPLRG